MSILLITHDLGIISENAERVAIMYAGRIMELAKTQELFRNPRNPYTLGLLGSIPREKGVSLTPIPGTVPRPGNLPPGCKFSDRCGFVKEFCRESEPPLELIAEAHFTRCFRAREL
jgi:oligopeptide/dipeptide ABC transporter ATP-binding protein